MDASCSKPHIRWEEKPLLKSIPCTPMAAALSPTAAITARDVTPPGKSVQATLFFPPITVWRGSHLRGRSKSRFPLPSANMLEKSPRLFSGDWLLPWRAEANAHFRLMLWTPGSPVLRPAAAEQNFDAVQPILIAERPVPNRHPSGLHDWPNANLLCLNAYTSKYHFAAGSHPFCAALHPRRCRQSQAARHRSSRTRRIILRSRAHRETVADRTAG